MGRAMNREYHSDLSPICILISTLGAAQLFSLSRWRAQMLLPSNPDSLVSPATLLRVGQLWWANGHCRTYENNCARERRPVRSHFDGCRPLQLPVVITKGQEDG